MTLEEIGQSIKAQIGTTREGVPHRLVHSTYGYIDTDATLLLEAFEQIQQAVMLIAAGIEDPKAHRAEAYLLMLLQQAWHHGYTPKDVWLWYSLESPVPL